MQPVTKKPEVVNKSVDKSTSTDVDLFGEEEESDSEDDNLRGVSNVVYRQEYNWGEGVIS